MAAWGGAGTPAAAAAANWADELEKEEAAGTHDANQPPPDVPTTFSERAGKARQLQAAEDDFPSLSMAAAKPVSKKKKAVKLDMRTFLAGGGAAPTSSASQPFKASRGGGPTNDKEILMSLPTGSRGKVEGEEADGPSGMGGAFKDYGGDRGEGLLLVPVAAAPCGARQERHAALLSRAHVRADVHACRTAAKTTGRRACAPPPP